MSGSPAFWRFLPGAAATDAEHLRNAAREGRGALARTLREARRELGAHRAAALVRRAEAEGRFGKPSILLVAAPFQPRAMEDALYLAFAIAGLSFELRPVDGFAALADALRQDDSKLLAGVDLVLLPLLETTFESVGDLAAALAHRCSAPVLLVSTGEGASATSEGEGVERVAIALDEPAVDHRFGQTFGAIPTAEAAERIADAAAARAARIAGTAPKLLVSDLDGTLWDGVLAEDGPGGLRLDEGYAGSLKQLADGGLLLALASRNDPRDVDAVFAAHPEWPLRRDGFVAAAIGWEGKDVLVAGALDALGLAGEHMVFIDDDPVNCARVAARFPNADVRLIAGDRAAFAAMLRDDLLLRQAGSVDGDRAERYRRRAAVEELRATSADVGDFLRRLRTVLTVVPLEPSLLPRAAELASRVNQFALNGWRPTAGELARRASPLDFMVRLDDAFGAHGLVGLVLATPDGRSARTDAFYLSCRALGRGVETAMLAALGELAREAGCERIVGQVETLPRNEPARRCFSHYLDVVGESSWTIATDGELAAAEGTTLRWARTTT